MGTDRDGFKNLDQTYQQDVEKLQARFDQKLEEKIQSAKLDSVGTPEMKRKATQAVKTNFWAENENQLNTQKKALEKVHFGELGGREKAKMDMEAYELEMKRAQLREQFRQKSSKDKSKRNSHTPSNQNIPASGTQKIAERTTDIASEKTQITTSEENSLEAKKSALRERFKKSTQNKDLSQSKKKGLSP